MVWGRPVCNVVTYDDSHLVDGCERKLTSIIVIQVVIRWFFCWFSLVGFPNLPLLDKCYCWFTCHHHLLASSPAIVLEKHTAFMVLVCIMIVWAILCLEMSFFFASLSVWVTLRITWDWCVEQYFIGISPVFLERSTTVRKTRYCRLGYFRWENILLGKFLRSLIFVASLCNEYWYMLLKYFACLFSSRKDHWIKFPDLRYLHLFFGSFVLCSVHWMLREKLSVSTILKS